MGQRKIDIQDISQSDGLNHVHQRVHKRHFQCVPFRGSVSHGMKEKSREKIKEKGKREKGEGIGELATRSHGCERGLLGTWGAPGIPKESSMCAWQKRGCILC